MNDAPGSILRTSLGSKYIATTASFFSYADGAYLLLDIGAADGALLELSGAREAAAVVPARDERAVHLPLEANLDHVVGGKFDSIRDENSTKNEKKRVSGGR